MAANASQGNNDALWLQQLTAFVTKGTFVMYHGEDKEGKLIGRITTWTTAADDPKVTIQQFTPPASSKAVALPSPKKEVVETKKEAVVFVSAIIDFAFVFKDEEGDDGSQQRVFDGIWNIFYIRFCEGFGGQYDNIDDFQPFPLGLGRSVSEQLFDDIERVRDALNVVFNTGREAGNYGKCRKVVGISDHFWFYLGRRTGFQLHESVATRFSIRSTADKKRRKLRQIVDLQTIRFKPSDIKVFESLFGTNSSFGVKFPHKPRIKDGAVPITDNNTLNYLEACDNNDDEEEPFKMNPNNAKNGVDFDYDKHGTIIIRIRYRVGPAKDSGLLGNDDDVGNDEGENPIDWIVLGALFDFEGKTCEVVAYDAAGSIVTAKPVAGNDNDLFAVTDMEWIVEAIKNKEDY